MELDDRIREVSDELCSIQKEMNRMLMRAISEGQGSPAYDHASALSTLADFKLVVDQLRQFLWFYLQVVNENQKVWMAGQMERARRPIAVGAIRM